MAKLRKFVSYRNLERPYTRVSKFRQKNFVRARPGSKIVRFEMGDKTRTFNSKIELVAQESGNIRHNALEAARITCNKLLDKRIPKNYHFKIRIYPHHVLRENPLAAGAGADRMSTGMKMSFGKPIGTAARVKKGQSVIEININKEHIPIAREAILRAAKKLPCSFRLRTQTR